MIRVIFFLFVGAVVFVAITGLSPWFFIIPIGLLALAAYTVGGMKLRCSSCGKRIKVGYNTCHHCGATFGARTR
jgi:hypothetical protein